MDAQNQHFESWDEICIAFQVARLGALCAAAELLGLPHATVIRHVDTLEKRLDPNMVQVLPAKPEWDTTIWLVTHIDLHRSAKVQAFTKFLKEQFANRQAKCKSCEGNL